MADVIAPHVRERMRLVQFQRARAAGFKAVLSPTHPIHARVHYEPRHRLYDDAPADPHDGWAERVLARGLVRREAPTVGDIVEPIKWEP